MELIPWKPFEGLGSLRTEMDNLWNRFLGETSPTSKFVGDWVPVVDVSETKDNFVVKAELPGMDAKDVKISVSGDILLIKGEKKEEKEEKDEDLHYVERSYGSFQRSFQLPNAIKAEDIEAKFDKGILKITLPKVEEAKKKEIEVKVK